MAINRDTLADQDGDFSDWVEIHNTSATDDLLLDGWYLTDNANQLGKWKFPPVSIAPSGYLVVFASAKDRSDLGEPLHTNFKLSNRTEFLALVKPDGASIAHEYAPAYPRQFADVSFGVVFGDQPDVDTVRHFGQPTPGAANSNEAGDNGPIVRDVTSLTGSAMPSDERDIVVTAQVKPTIAPIDQVMLTYRVMFEPEVTISMFDDGENGDGQANDGIYGAAIPAAASAPGQMVRWYVSATDTESGSSRYPVLGNPTEAPQYQGTVIADPSIESNLPEYHWFVEDTRNLGLTDQQNRGTRASLYYDGEFYDNIFARVRGGSARSYPKKNYKLDFNPGYHFRFSPDYGRVEELNLNSNYGDKAFVRQVVSFETFRDAGVPYSETFMVRLQQNAEFYSVAIFVEQPDEDYLERQGLDGNGALYKVFGKLDRRNSRTTKRTRLDESWDDLDELMAGLALRSADRNTYIFDNINIPEAVNYFAAIIMTDDSDWVHKNYFVHRDSDGTGEWSMLPWDKDLTFGRNWVGDGRGVLNDDMGAGASPANSWFTSNRLAGAIMGRSSPATREMYFRRIRTLLDELYQPADTPPDDLRYEARVDELVAQIGADADLDFDRWQPYDYGSLQDIDEGVRIMKEEHLAVRRPRLYGISGLPDAQPADAKLQIGAIDVTPADGNQDAEYIEITNPNSYAVDVSGWRVAGTVGFTFRPGTVIPSEGSLYLSPDVNAFRARQSGPASGQGLFVQGGYDGRLGSAGGDIRVINLDNVEVASHVYTGDPTALQQSLRVTEVNFHPADPTAKELADNPNYDDNSFEFIELQNTGQQPLDLSNVRLSGGVDFAFTSDGGPAPVLAPGQYAVVVLNRGAFQSRYGNGIEIAGQYDRRLGNGGDTIKLTDNLDNTIQEFAYDDAWYPQADGAGRTLEIIDPLNPNLAVWGQKDGWRASPQFGGSPSGLTQPIPGDSNQDGVFNSSDLVLVLQAGEFDDGIPNNSTFEEGDWNGDGDFDSSDLVFALQFGNYT